MAGAAYKHVQRDAEQSANMCKQNGVTCIIYKIYIKNQLLLILLLLRM